MSGSLGRILVVDDEPPVLEVLSEYFSTQGYTVETALNGSDALAAAQRRRPDLVLLDIRMPGMDGVEVLRRLRDVDPGIPVIMVTANEDVSVARETLKIGAFDYVAKPFDFRYLERAVAASLVRSAAAPAPPDEPVAAGTADVWYALAVAVFRAARAMPAIARSATGDRLEAASLAAAREAKAGRGSEAAAHLGELGLVLRVASDLGDLPAAARSAIEAAMSEASKTLPSGR